MKNTLIWFLALVVSAIFAVTQALPLLDAQVPVACVGGGCQPITACTPLRFPTVAPMTCTMLSSTAGICTGAPCCQTTDGTVQYSYFYDPRPTWPNVWFDSITRLAPIPSCYNSGTTGNWTGNQCQAAPYSVTGPNIVKCLESFTALVGFGNSIPPGCTNGTYDWLIHHGLTGCN